MNSTIKTLFALAATAVCFWAASCSKDNVTVEEFTATMEECTEQDSKTTLHNGFLYWQQGDQIKVYGNSGNYGVYTGNNVGGVTTFSLTSGDPGSGGYTAIYPASAANDDGTIELPAVQVTNDGSLTGFPMYATSSTTDLEFMHLCGVLRLRLQKSGFSVSAIEITSDVELTGRHSITVSGGEPSLTYVSYGAGNPHKSVMLVCNTAQNIGSPKDFYIYLPEHNYTSLRIRIYSNDGKVCTKTLNSGASVGISRGRITTITMSSSLSFTPNAGRLNGLFSVSDSKQVYFSQGNLQYTTLGIHNTATGTMPGIWRFAPNQYDIVGEANSNISSTYTGWIDLFGWGTGSSPTLASVDYSDYQIFMDWGGNAISNGGNAINLWHTLSQTEWEYLFSTRTNITNLGTDNARYAKSRVNNVVGVILFPDGYVHPTGIAVPIGINNDDGGYNTNYTLSQWAEIEIAGAVFLPAVGDRWGMGVSYVDSDGYYWSSTINTTETAYSMGFNGSWLGVAGGGWRNFGFSTRLVRDNN